MTDRRWNTSTWVVALLAGCVPAASPMAPQDTGVVVYDDAFAAPDAPYAPDAPRAACAALDAPCRVAADCCSQSCSLDGVCHAPPVHACSVDTDCGTGQHCQTCNHSCVYPPGGACDTSAPCPCDYFCTSNLCRPIGDTQPAMCLADTDCPINEFCNRAVFQCQVPMIMVPGSSRSCTTNADCGVGEMCSDANVDRTCMAVGVTECRTDADCSDPENPTCTENQCFHRGAC